MRPSYSLTPYTASTRCTILLATTIVVVFVMSSFRYALIPCDGTQPVIFQRAEKAGGLENDQLVKRANEYFRARRPASSSSSPFDAIDDASPEERRALADEVRKQHPGSEGLDDDALLTMMKTARSSAGSSCEIRALVIPTAANGHVGVSAYGASDAGEETPVNERAVALLRACGHAAANDAVRGDAFVGRYLDDEKRDVWERADFGVDEVDPKSEWCRLARRAGGGGGSGGAAPSSSDPTGKGNVVAISSPYDWSQTDEEVELSLSVDAGASVEVRIARSTLRVSVAGETLVNGETGGDVAVDDSTYTIQDSGKDGKKELTVTLAKRNEGLRWNYAVLDDDA